MKLGMDTPEERNYARAPTVQPSSFAKLARWWEFAQT